MTVCINSSWIVLAIMGIPLVCALILFAVHLRAIVKANP